MLGLAGFPQHDGPQEAGGFCEKYAQRSSIRFDGCTFFGLDTHCQASSKSSVPTLGRGDSSSDENDMTLARYWDN
jgi:hypothetical protein